LIQKNRDEKGLPRWFAKIEDEGVYMVLTKVVDFSHLLHLYIHMNEIDNVETLLKENANLLNKFCLKGIKNAIHFACERGDIAIIKKLMQYGAVLNETCLLYSCSSVKLETIKFIYSALIEKNGKVNIKETDINKRNVLHSALYGTVSSIPNLQSVLQFLISCGADECLLMPDQEGTTPLALSELIDPGISQYLHLVNDFQKAL
jgi:hypothetical protein